MTEHNNPLKYAGGYTLDLYCKHDNPDHPIVEHGGTYFRQFYGQTFGECSKEARKMGWVIHRDRTATCPRCATK